MKGPANGAWSGLLQPEMVVALAAVVIGVCALAISVVQVQIMREEQHAAVWPSVELGFDESRSDAGTQEFAILVMNQGLGPALMRDFRVELDGTPVRDWASVLPLFDPGLPEGLGAVSQETISTGIILSGQRVEPLRLRTPAHATAFASNVDRLVFSWCYCSVYDKCWQRTFTSRDFDGPYPAPRPVDSCERSADSFSN